MLSGPGACRDKWNHRRAPALSDQRPDGPKRRAATGLEIAMRLPAIVVVVLVLVGGEEIRRVDQHAVEIEGALVEQLDDRHVGLGAVVDFGEFVDLADLRLHGGEFVGGDEIGLVQHG